MQGKFITSSGFVFRTFNAKEADRVVHVLKYTGEREVLVAKGIKRSTSRKAHAIDLFNLIEYSTIKGNADLATITEVKLVNGAEKFKQDYQGLLFVQAVCEVVNTFVAQDQEDPAYYKNLINLLEVHQPNLAQMLAALILRFILASGDLPKLNEDVHTAEDILPGELRYTTNMIGYTKAGNAAGLGVEVGEAVPDRIYKVQKFIITHDFNSINTLSLTPQEQQQMLSIHMQWLRLFVQKDLPACDLFFNSYFIAP